VSCASQSETLNAPPELAAFAQALCWTSQLRPMAAAELMNWELSVMKPSPPGTTGGGRPPRAPVKVWTLPPEAAAAGAAEAAAGAAEATAGASEAAAGASETAAGAADAAAAAPVSAEASAVTVTVAAGGQSAAASEATAGGADAAAGGAEAAAADAAQAAARRGGEGRHPPHGALLRRHLRLLSPHPAAKRRRKMETKGGIRR